MGNSLLKSDYTTVLTSVLGNKIGSEITLAEAERMFFPFCDPGDNYIILRRHNTDYAYTLLYGDEKCVYKVIDANEYDVMQSLDFNGVEIGELTELGCVPVSNGGAGILIFKAENDSTYSAGFFSGGLNLTVSTEVGKISAPVFFGKKVYFQYTPGDEMDSGQIVVYAKYKPHSLTFDFQADQSSTYSYFLPCIASGYRLTRFILNPGWNNETSAFHFYKKAKGDVLNDTQLAVGSSASRGRWNWYALNPTGGAEALKTHYSDICFGSKGTISTPVYASYRAQLLFARI